MMANVPTIAQKSVFTLNGGRNNEFQMSQIEKMGSQDAKGCKNLAIFGTREKT